MTVRKVLSPRGAKAEVEAALASLVDAAVFIGRADGRFSEDELDVFIDTLREVVSSAVGDDFVAKWATTPRLLDLARAARVRLNALGHEAYLAEVVQRFPSEFRREALVLAYRIVLADGHVTAAEADSFRALAGAFGLGREESAILEELAHRAEASSRAGHRGGAIEEVLALREHGWREVHAGPGPHPPEAEWHDVVLEAPGAGDATLRLELDATESVLHLHVRDAHGAGPMLVFLYAGHLGGLLAVIQAVRGQLAPATVADELPALKAVCPDVFVKDAGAYRKA